MSGKRSIFEDVPAGAEAPRQHSAPTAGGGLIERERSGSRGAIKVWLVVLFVLVMVMIAVGGATRLTDSGLSITEWRPVTGALPPISDVAWMVEFEKYRQIPQYQIVNRGMSLEDFKVIYWWEWGHRQLGRLIGLVWAAGFLFFWATRRIPDGWRGRLLLLGALGGLQGAIGWWMVASGLQGEMVRVASYRLAVHLGLAFVILGFLAWYVFLIGLRPAALLSARRAGDRKLFGLSTGLMHLAFLQVVLGALVAGIDAGRAFPTWPDMNGSFLPPDPFYVPDGGATWRAFFENPGLVQFSHRMVGYALFAFGVVVWLLGRRAPQRGTRMAYDWMVVMLFGQVVLGVITVISAAPLHLALGHQVGAVALWVLVLNARFRARYPRTESIRGGVTK